MTKFIVKVKTLRLVEVEAEDEDAARDLVMDRICDSDEFEDEPLEITEIDSVFEAEE